MSPEEIQMHLAAGHFYGRESTCVGKRVGKEKIKHTTEEQADAHAASHNALLGAAAAHEVEAYPCYFSAGREDGIYHWHVGRKMTEGEREMFSSPRNEESADG
jgi:hypothetical protein